MEQQSIFELETYGFTILQTILEVNEVAALKAMLIHLDQQNKYLSNSPRHVINSIDGAGKVHKEQLLRNLPTRDPIFFNLIDHPKVLPIIEYFLGHHLILGSLNARIVRSGTPEQKLHSDIPEALMKLGNPVMMNTVWLLDDFTVDNGGTCFVPGTHRSVYPGPPSNMQIKYIHQITAPAGSVLIFNGQCWHGAGANTSNQDRHALFGHYRIGTWMRFQFDPHHGFPEEWLSRLTTRQKQLLRMENGLGTPHGADAYEDE
jgi:ectoine hydroxylase-related dioxygenase (phytanoyl-CoA dioxygenase family)